MEGVSGLKFGFSAVEALKLLLKDGVFGVGGKLSEDSAKEERLRALCIGKKIPEPGTEVVK
jgi:hypothetical protein